MPTATSMSLTDFTLVSRLGDGSYSEVYLARHDATGAEYALKIVNKQHILRYKVVHQVQRERILLSRLQYDGIIKLHFTFQDADSLYLGLDYCPNGELFDQIRIHGKLDVATTKFYAAEIVLVLEVLRQEGIVHRDLKPENLLLTSTGHLKLIDFGSAKDIKAPDTFPKAPDDDSEAAGNGNGNVGGERASSFVGTADYVCPEMLSNKPVGYEADLWALGCVIYQMFMGRSPFKAASEYLTFEKITSGEFTPLGEDIPAEGRDIVSKLLQLDPSARIGSSDLGELKRHPFFLGIEWEGQRSSEAPTPVRAETAEDGDQEIEEFDWELQSLRAHKSGLQC